MTDKLTIETKKILAEKVIGYTWDCEKYDYCFFKNGVSFLCVEDYNPDQNTPEGLSQFVELISKLDDTSIIKIGDYLCHKYNDYDDIMEFDAGLVSFNWLCSHQYEVCMAIKEVI